MDRPYIICHMVTSLDGKVTGDFLGRDAHYGIKGIKPLTPEDVENIVRMCR